MRLPGLIALTAETLKVIILKAQTEEEVAKLNLGLLSRKRGSHRNMLRGPRINVLVHTLVSARDGRRGTNGSQSGAILSTQQPARIAWALRRHSRERPHVRAGAIPTLRDMPLYACLM